MDNFNITLFEACETLNRSKKSVSRYIRRGLLHPKKVKSKQGTLEYRFNKEDLEQFKQQEQTGQDRTGQGKTGHDEIIDELTNNAEAGKSQEIKEKTDKTRQDTPDRTDRTEQTGQDSEVIILLKETTNVLQYQLKVKDEQIKGLGDKIDQLIERDRETNIILKGLQDKLLMLEQPEENADQEQQTNASEPATKSKPKKRGFWRNVLLLDKQLPY